MGNQEMRYIFFTPVIFLLLRYNFFKVPAISLASAYVLWQHALIPNSKNASLLIHFNEGSVLQLLKRCNAMSCCGRAVLKLPIRIAESMWTNDRWGDQHASGTKKAASPLLFNVHRELLLDALLPPSGWWRG